jgi:hypothetical protein
MRSAGLCYRVAEPFRTHERMTMKKNFVRMLTLVAAVGVAACGDDDGPIATGDPLTDVEAQALSEVILETAFSSTAGGFGGVPAAVDGPQAAPVPFSTSVDISAPCDGGGTVSIAGDLSGTVDNETGEFDATYNVTQSHSNCVATSADQQTFTLNGATALGFAFSAVTQGELTTFDWDGTLTGTIDWATGEKSGSCSLSLTYTADYTGQSITATSTGTVCGVTVNQEFSYGFGT